MLHLGYDALGEIFSWITDIDDIKHLLVVCHDFNTTIKTAIVKILTPHQKCIPYQWFSQFTRIKLVVPCITFPTSYFQLPKSLKMANFAIQPDKEAIIHAKELYPQLIDQTFIFGLYSQATKSFSPTTMIKRDYLLHIGENSAGHYFKVKQAIVTDVVVYPPSEVEDFTILLTGQPINFIPPTHPLLERKRFGVMPTKSDLNSQPMVNYINFGNAFTRNFYRGKYQLQDLDVPISPYSFIRIMEEKWFDHLCSISVMVDSISEAERIRIYLEGKDLHPLTIRIYALTEYIRHRIKSWSIPLHTILPLYPPSLEDIVISN